MIHTEFSWQSTDYLTLYAQLWEPQTASKAMVCLIHGLGEHSGRYQHVAEVFTAAGYSMLGFDLPGHGKSGGQRGHVPSEETFLYDIDGLLQAAARRHPGEPRILYGHSLGGLLALFYTIRRCPDVKAVIASSPGLRTPLTEQKVKVALSKTLAPLLPTTSLVTGLDAREISRDSRVV